MANRHEPPLAIDAAKRNSERISKLEQEKARFGIQGAPGLVNQWTKVSFENGWGGTGPGWYYIKDQFGWVSFVGWVATLGSSSTEPFKMPAGVRVGSAQNESAYVINCGVGGLTGYIQFFSNGKVLVAYTGGTSVIHLAGVRYLAEA